ncbi:MAG: F-type H+-transporting ATPase subunit delta [Frankiales bacterium]|jgi:F-type H+-transporting ATPase subunit delta|nr:F-type H+-transporting ATPase subunit delta [Frankiales bacterium]
MAVGLLGASREALAAARERLDAGVANLGPEELTRLGEDLFAVADLLYREGRLRRALSDPGLAEDARSRLAQQLLGEQLSAPAFDVVQTLVTSRWSRPVDLVDAADLLGVQAVLAAAERAEELEDVEDELFRFARILERQPELQVVLGDITVPVEPRIQLLQDVLRDKVRPTTLRLATEAVRAPRGRRLDRVLEDYVRFAAERRQRLVAEVWTAVPLTDEQTARLGDALATAFGRRVQIQSTVDTSLLGGLTVRVGDEVIDGSIVNRVELARRRIAG